MCGLQGRISVDLPLCPGWGGMLFPASASCLVSLGKTVWRASPFTQRSSGMWGEHPGDGS